MSCIKHIEGTYMSIIRDDYVYLCEGNVCSALILNEFENWMNVKTRMRKTNLWTWKTQEDLKKEIYGIFGIRTIRKSLDWLLKKKYLLRQRNPRKKFDKTYQYKINVIKVNTELRKIEEKIYKERQEKEVSMII